MIGEILLCALAAALVLVLLWLLLAQLLLPLETRSVYLVLNGRGDGDDLEQNCRAYLLLRGLGIFRKPLLLLDTGLSSEGKRLAQSLAGLDPAIELLDAAELSNRLDAE